MTRALLFSCLALALVTSACQDQKTEPTAPAVGVELKQASLPKLNRNHLITGEQALILPCIGRTETDLQATRAPTTASSDAGIRRM